jgi:hypothetical protein
MDMDVERPWDAVGGLIPSTKPQAGCMWGRTVSDIWTWLIVSSSWRICSDAIYRPWVGNGPWAMVEYMSLLTDI